MSKDYKKAYHKMVREHLKRFSKIIKQIEKLYDENGIIPDENMEELDRLTKEMEQNGRYYDEQTAIYKKAKAEDSN